MMHLDSMPLPLGIPTVALGRPYARQLLTPSKQTRQWTDIPIELINVSGVLYFFHVDLGMLRYDFDVTRRRLVSTHRRYLATTYSLKSLLRLLFMWAE